MNTKFGNDGVNVGQHSSFSHFLKLFRRGSYLLGTDVRGSALESVGCSFELGSIAARCRRLRFVQYPWNRIEEYTNHVSEKLAVAVQVAQRVLDVDGRFFRLLGGTQRSRL